MRCLHSVGVLLKVKLLRPVSPGSGTSLSGASSVSVPLRHLPTSLAPSVSASRIPVAPAVWLVSSRGYAPSESTIRPAFARLNAAWLDAFLADWLCNRSDVMQPHRSALSSSP